MSEQLKKDTPRRQNPIQQFGMGVLDIGRISPKTPTTRLLNLEIPSQYKDMIVPTLAKLGFTTRKETHRDFAGVERSFTSISNNEIIRFLLWIPNDILENPAPECSTPVLALSSWFIYEFGKEIPLYIFHDETPHISYKHLVENIWPKKLGIEAKFVALSHLEDIQEYEQDLRGKYFIDMFKLDVEETISGEEREMLEKRLVSLRNQRSTESDKLNQLEEEEKKYGVSVPFKTRNSIKETKESISNIDKELEVIRKKIKG